MTSRFTNPADAVAPFQAFEVAPTYHPVTDGITGYRSYPDTKGGFFETLAGVKARVRAGWTEDALQDISVEIRDSLGRVVLPDPDPRPMPAPSDEDDILF